MRTQQLTGLISIPSVARLLRKVAGALDTRTVMVAALLLFGIAMQIALLLSVGRAPSDTFLPHSAVSAVAEVGTQACEMFCDEPALDESAARAFDFTPRADDIRGDDEVRLSASGESAAHGTCWMFCEQAGRSSGATEDASTPDWHLVL